MLAGNRREFWTPEVLRSMLRGLAGILLFMVLVIYFVDENSAKIGKGDFPVFYSGAVAAAQGDYLQLYDFEYHTELQNRIWPALQGNVHPFVYPPFVAVLLSPLARLSATQAHLAFIGVMSLCFLCSVFLAQGFSSLVRGRVFDSICCLILFAPLTTGIFGAQNTALSLLFYSAILFFMSRGGKTNEFFAGVFAGLWFFKPHFPLIVIFFMALARCSSFLLGALGPVLAYYAVGAIACGWSWPISWVFEMWEFSHLELRANSFQLVSLNGVFSALARSLVGGEVVWISRIVAWCVSVLIALALGVSAFGIGRKREEQNDVQRKTELSWLVAALGPAMVLISPHTHYYDLAICCYPLAQVLKFRSDRSITLGLLGFLFVFYCTSFRSAFVASPLVLFAVCSFWIVYSNGNLSMPFAIRRRMTR